MAARFTSGLSTVLIAGASGLVGRALVPWLQSQGYVVRRLVRQSPVAADEFRWNPTAGVIDPAALVGVDAVVNLAGENLAAGRWTARRREAILRSRIDATRTLVSAVVGMDRRPAGFVNASATGIYGDRGDETLTEASAPGTGFLTDVCRAWEAELAPATAVGIRTVALRTGVILSASGGALVKMLPAFRAGVGGRLGSGRQWMSWISADDLVGVIGHCLTHPDCRGAINAVAPQPVTNAEFTATLGRVLRRPAILPVPAFVLRLLFGRMADEALLSSTRAVPKTLLGMGYEFSHGDIESALRRLLSLAQRA